MVVVSVSMSVSMSVSVQGKGVRFRDTVVSGRSQRGQRGPSADSATPSRRAGTSACCGAAASARRADRPRWLRWLLAEGGWRMQARPAHSVAAAKPAVLLHPLRSPRQARAKSPLQRMLTTTRTRAALKTQGAGSQAAEAKGSHAVV